MSHNGMTKAQVALYLYKASFKDEPNGTKVAVSSHKLLCGLCPALLRGDDEATCSEYAEVLNSVHATLRCDHCLKLYPAGRHIQNGYLHRRTKIRL